VRLEAMEPVTLAVIGVLFAAVVVAPLAREYADLRNTFGLSRTAAFGTTVLVVPAFAVGSTLALPLADRPAAQWLVAVAATLVLYSLATRAIVARASAAETAPSRRI
jgi:uncharacterized membrane-anchored protein